MQLGQRRDPAAARESSGVSTAPPAPRAPLVLPETEWLPQTPPNSAEQGKGRLVRWETEEGGCQTWSPELRVTSVSGEWEGEEGVKEKLQKKLPGNWQRLRGRGREDSGSYRCLSVGKATKTPRSQRPPAVPERGTSPVAHPRAGDRGPKGTAGLARCAVRLPAH